MKIERYPIDLQMDTGLTQSVVTQPVGPLSQRHVSKVGTLGDQTHHPFLVSRKYSLGKYNVRHKFLYFPDCSVVLIDRYLCKLRAQITLTLVAWQP
jgi:hypothetical protein